MRKNLGLGLLAAALLLGACGGDDGGSGGDDDGGGNIFEPKPECEGAPVVAFAGNNTQVISKLEIGAKTDGFDLDGNGTPDNALSAVGSLAQESIDDSLKNYDILIPIELFDVSGAVEDACVKFAIYLGVFGADKDGDDARPSVENGDSNDNNPAQRRGATEIAANGIDDDCDGLADEDENNTPSTSTADEDEDGVSIAAGDCDDTNPAVHRGAAEICGDGLDNDCDGVADRSVDGTGAVTACSPFNPGQADIALDPLSFQTGTQTPVISFKDGTFTTKDGKLTLNAGPSLFSVAIPVTDGITLDLRISGAQIEGDVVTEAGSVVINNARLGGVLDAITADTIRGLELEEIGLTPENSLLDATFANLLGPLLALPKASEAVQAKYNGCRTPDIDVDGDGLEAFCDSNLDDDLKAVDVCIDGDGTEVTDVGTMQCSAAQKDGTNRFVDGISVALKFSTTAIKSILPPAQ